ncbi:MAG: hypothetical protein RQ842_08115 [Vulcanisaeta sp.]|nr:hypothetical protein [Vulcanisaeta sp.]
MYRIFNQILGLGSPLIVDSDNLYVNPTAIITNAVLIATAYLVLASGKPRVGLTKYALGIITIYALIATALFLVIATEPSYTCTSIPVYLDGAAILTASIIIDPITPLIYAYERVWRVSCEWGRSYSRRMCQSGINGFACV